MRDLFDEKDFRRILYILRNRKANSVCGDRDGIHLQKYKQKFADPSSVKKNGLQSSRRSMSIYSERQGEDPKRFEWRYRVKNRDHIPQFFQDPVESQ